MCCHRICIAIVAQPTMRHKGGRTPTKGQWGASGGWVQCWEVEGKDNQADRNRNVYLFIFYIFATCLVSGIGDSDADSAAGATSAAVCCQLGCLLYAMYFSKPA